MMETWGCTPSAQAYDSSPWPTVGAMAAIAGSGSAMPTPEEVYMTRPRLGVSRTVAPATLPAPESDFMATATTPPAGFMPMAARGLKWSVVTIGIWAAALALGETRNCWSRVGAIPGAVVGRVRVVLAGTSREKAPVESVVVWSPQVRTGTAGPATGAPLRSRTWPVTVARSLAVVGVSGAV